MIILEDFYILGYLCSALSFTVYSTVDAQLLGHCRLAFGEPPELNRGVCGAVARNKYDRPSCT